MHPHVRGQGIGTEFGRQLLSRGCSELGLHRIYATCRSAEYRLFPGPGEARYDARGTPASHPGDP
ncbi:GNAT family N-acetyltransferase [Streptomyces mirabilis]|uniref:GNAT family N-acetyltransferase n=1 Tax=Streptomyces mirabilis TaxID=68239 RepID=UPI0036B4466B